MEFSDPAYEQEGLRFATVRSRALGRRADCTFWSPAENSECNQIGTLLILLHGVYGSAWVWPLKAGVHRTAERLLQEGTLAPLVIAMPSDGLFGDGSAYLQKPEDAERWIVEEVPALARLAQPALSISPRVAIAGLSMGGYGALRLGARYPERFSAISAHSAITDIAEMVRFVEEPLEQYVFAAEPEGLSIMHWMMRNRESLPPIRLDCGLDDSLIEGNRRLHAALEAAGISHGYEEFAGGHDWAYWTRHIEETLLFVAPAVSSTALP